MNETRRGAGRPPTPVLTRERVLDAAFRLAGDRSPAQFTMTALAASLGVRTSALYHHFDGRDAVIRAMRSHIASLIDDRLLDVGSVVEALRGWGRGYRDALLSAPGAITLLAVQPIDADDLSFAQYEAIAVRLEGDGWPPETIADAIVAIESFIIGSAIDALAPDDNMSPGSNADAYPRFAEAERLRRARDGRPADRTFEIGLAALVSGLRAWATSARGVTGAAADD